MRDQIRQRSGGGRGLGRADGAGTLESPGRDIPQPCGDEPSRRLQEAAHRARPRSEGAHPPPDRFALEQIERASAELRRDLRVRIEAEPDPDLLQGRHLAPACLARREVSGELPSRRRFGLSGQTIDRAGNQVAAVHVLSPSEKRAFSASTARKMRVLTAPTEMPSVSAISAYGIPW